MQPTQGLGTFHVYTSPAPEGPHASPDIDWALAPCWLQKKTAPGYPGAAEESECALGLVSDASPLFEIVPLDLDAGEVVAGLQGDGTMLLVNKIHGLQDTQVTASGRVRNVVLCLELVRQLVQLHLGGVESVGVTRDLAIRENGAALNGRNALPGGYAGGEFGEIYVSLTKIIFHLIAFFLCLLVVDSLVKY